MAEETEIRNKEDFLGIPEKNSDGTPVQEVVKDGEPTAEIRNKEDFLGISEKNSDGTPVKEVVPNE